tara:strand:- start:4210 stop:4698 length:489 start_codon:yes stop_codon:yes gene_type:complete
MKQIVIGQGVVDWVADHMKRGEGYGLSTGIGLVKDGELVAGVVYNEYNHCNINMHVAAIGRDWLTREYLWTCFDYPFNRCKVRRITGFVEDDNAAALRFDEHLGFKYETRLKDAYIHDDRVGDIIVLVMRREDCRWLDVKTKVTDAPLKRFLSNWQPTGLAA